MVRSLVILILKSDFPSLDMKYRMHTFIQSLESSIGNYREPLYEGTNPNKIYNSFIYYYIEDDNV